jgi:medium-chain acyl-[acyl-carrier-protein] hydrolase
MTHLDAHGWLVRPRPVDTPRWRLVGIPHAGAGASVFATWPDLLPPTIEVCAVQAPGRENRLGEVPYRRVRPLVGAIADALGPLFDAPYALFGHSLGALVSFELARELRRRGRPDPRHLFVSGRAAPHLPPRRPPIHALSDEAFRAQIRRFAGTPDEILEHEELMQILLPGLRADFELVETYRYHDERPLECPVTALGGVDDPWVTRDELEAWRVHTSAGFRIAQWPGQHFYLQSERAGVLALVADTLSRAENAS